MFLNNLYETANTNAFSNEKENEEISKNYKTETENTNRSKNMYDMRKNIMKDKTIKHSSEFSQKNVNYKQYKYKRYEDIISRMKHLARKYPTFLKIETAQKLYGLPNPGGYCGKKKKKM